MSRLENICAVAFDLDGTLVDSAPGLAYAVDMALYALELPQAGKARVMTWIGNGADVMMKRALCWAWQEREAQRANAGQSDIESVDLSEEGRVRMLRKLFDSYYAESVEEGSTLFPGVADTLEVLHAHGIPMGLATNKPTPFVAPLLNVLNIAHYFRVTIGGNDVENKKPHPEPVLLVAKQLGVAPETLLFVGDSRNDILAASAAGALSVGLTYGYNYGEAIALSNPDWELERFSDVLPVLGFSHSENQE